ncbi:MAG: regulatory protein RecX [Oscillospiraceae bacterium]
MAETPAERAKARALRLLEKRDYSEAELAAKLVEKGDDPDSARAAAARMAELGFVNDENYAAMVVRHYAAKGYGRARIREELRRRKLPRELWDAALDELPEQSDTVERLLMQKLRGRAPEGAELRRACAALIRRGFSWEEVSPRRRGSVMDWSWTNEGRHDLPLCEDRVASEQMLKNSRTRPRPRTTRRPRPSS